MKTRIKILIVSCVIAAAAVTGFNMAQNSNNMDVTLTDISIMALARGESGGNQATCYSTYEDTLFGGTNIWVCGSCVQVKAKNYHDSGICYF